MSVYAATQERLSKLGAAAESSHEAQVALSLAAVLDDRAGIQNGGSASTAKQYLATMDLIAERYQSKTTSRLSVLRGTA